MNSKKFFNFLYFFLNKNKIKNSVLPIFSKSKLNYMPRRKLFEEKKYLYYIYIYTYLYIY